MTGLQKKLERNMGLLIFGILFASSVGGLAQILPSLSQPSLSTPTPGLAPPDALQLAGREVYVRESCSLCHTQHIRPLLAEVKRDGPASRAGEFVYDRPFLWGSKRTGPDLHRVGGKYSDDWHRIHLLDPRAVVPGSIMPAYPWLAERGLDVSGTQKKMLALRKLGHPYSDEDILAAKEMFSGKTEMDALIAYLQSLGTGGGNGESAGDGGAR